MRAWALLLMFASGFAGLGYQIAWTSQSALWIGHESAAMLAIVAAFFGGIGLGALLTGRRIDASRRPARWYAGCEASIGIWALLLTMLMSPVSEVLLDLIGPEPGALRHWSLAFIGTFVLLLPATAAMGATLPAMERLLNGAGSQPSSIARLYSANTFGAMAGALISALVLVPRLGFTATTTVCAALNLLCALFTWQWRGQDAPPAPAKQRADRGPLTTLAITGLLGIGYEVLMVRVLSQVAENTIFTFAILLAVYLAGTAIGAAAYARLGADPADPVMRNSLLRWQALACLLGMATLIFAERIKATLMPWFGSGMAAALTAEAVLACAAFLLPTLVMGALFSQLASAARAAGHGFGTAIGVNTLAASLAPILFGVLLLPWLGNTLALLLLILGYLLAVSPRGWRSAAQIGVAASVAAFALWHPPLAAVGVPPGGNLISHAEGVSATVSVIADGGGIHTLHINNRQQEGSSATLYSDARQALLPLLLHPDPHQVLFLGLGTGTTARVAARDASLQVDAVELLPEVIAATATFALLERQAGAASRQPRMFTADARRYVRATRMNYDVIIADNFHPARSGSASLYTREHFVAVRERLAPGGVFCQWLPLHQLDLTTLRSIARTFTSVYPRGWALLATNSLDTPVLGLVARRDGEVLDRSSMRMEQPGFGLEDDLALFGSFIAGSEALEKLGAGAPLNSDDHPVVAYLAPRITYAPDSAPRDRLMTLLGDLHVTPDELFGKASDGRWNQRLAAYWSARDRFIAVGRDIRPSRDVRAMLAQVAAPLLDVLRISADFRPAYDPLLRMAEELANTDAAGASALLGELARLQPQRREAGEALAALRNPR